TRPRAFTFSPTMSDDGRFIFPLVPPGNYSLSTEDPDVVPVSWALAVGTNGATGLQLDVSEGAEVQGTAVDQTGRLTSATVELRPKPADSAFTAISPPMNTAFAGATLGAARFIFPGPGATRNIAAENAALRRPSLEHIWDRILEVARTRVR